MGPSGPASGGNSVSALALLATGSAEFTHNSFNQQQFHVKEKKKHFTFYLAVRGKKIINELFKRREASPILIYFQLVKYAVNHERFPTKINPVVINWTWKGENIIYSGITGD